MLTGEPVEAHHYHGAQAAGARISKSLGGQLG